MNAPQIPDDQYVIYVSDYTAQWDAARYARIMARSYVREARRLRRVGMLPTAKSTLTRASCWRAEAQRLVTFPQGRSMARQDVEWFVHTRWADAQRVYL